MDVSIIVPVQASEEADLALCLDGIFAQRYADGRIEVLAVQYGGASLKSPIPSRPGVRLLAVNHPTPYAARNLAASQARGEAFLFTEPGCVPEPDWAAAHVARLRGSAVTVSVGRVAPARETRLVDVLYSYEDLRDAWVFSGPRWQHYFGRPKNMAIARRRFATHGPFVEVARGADSKLVQEVVREVSCDEVALTQDAVVRQRSIRGLPSCLRDRYLHGHALQTHQSSHAAPIALGERLRLFRAALTQRGYGPVGAATLVSVLGAGILVFRVGGWMGSAARSARR